MSSLCLPCTGIEIPRDTTARTANEGERERKFMIRTRDLLILTVTRSKRLRVDPEFDSPISHHDYHDMSMRMNLSLLSPAGHSRTLQLFCLTRPCARLHSSLLCLPSACNDSDQGGSSKVKRERERESAPFRALVNQQKRAGEREFVIKFGPQQRSC